MYVRKTLHSPSWLYDGHWNQGHLLRGTRHVQAKCAALLPGGSGSPSHTVSWKNKTNNSISSNSHSSVLKTFLNSVGHLVLLEDIFLRTEIISVWPKKIFFLGPKWHFCLTGKNWRIFKSGTFTPIDLSPKARHCTCWQTFSLWRHNQMARQVAA